MAGIGFSLNKLLRQGSLFGVLKAYGYAAMIGSGPWVLSTLGMMLIGVIGLGFGLDHQDMIRFMVSVTYLMAASLLITSGTQLMLTRFLADRLFEGHEKEVLPNVLGSVLFTMLICLLLFLVLQPLFSSETLLYQLLMLMNLVVLCAVWLLMVITSGLNIHKLVVGLFFLGYGGSVIVALLLSEYGLNGLLLGFFIGHSFLMFSLLALGVWFYPSTLLLRFNFLVRGKSIYSIAIIGGVYCIGAWADKIIFWLGSGTSDPIIGPLRASILYDPPMFLAYVFSIPGMSVLLLKMEVDFSHRCREYYEGVNRGATLMFIQQSRSEMINTIRQGFYGIAKIQGMIALALIVFSDKVIVLFGLSENYQMIFVVDVLAVTVQILFLAIMNVFFYLDKRIVLLWVTIFFAVSNIGFSLWSQALGPEFYGYGFALSMVLTTVFGLLLLNRTLSELEYETFMLQK